MRKKQRLLYNLINLLVILSFIAVLGVLNNTLAASPSVFINEIHYDNASTDTGEAIEIAGPADTDLSNWNLVLYNGNGGAVYTTTALSGTIPDLGNGFGVVVFYYGTNGIQNGSPDGLALVDSGNNVIQFLSYEGSFVATDGPAKGMNSVDLGVAEASNTQVGDSLQLNGNGAKYDDFSWSSPAPNTFDAFNTNQSFSTQPRLAVVINEIDYDQPSTDTAEFIELKNNETTTVDLSQFTLELVNGNGNVVYKTIALPSITLAAGDYFVVCGDGATVANCDLDVSPDSNLIQNGSPDAVGLHFNGILIDAVSYEGDTGAPYTEGTGVGLEDNPADVGKGISRCADGTDTNQNSIDFQFNSITPGETNSCGTEPIEAKIHEIQGTGSSVAIKNPVTVEAIVIGDYQNGDQLSGFFIQEEDSDADSNVNTSEGIFVYCSGCATDVAVGDLVQVTGMPEEFFGMSQIDVTGSEGVVGVISSDNLLPTAFSIDLPASGSTTEENTFEYVEGMLVTFKDKLVVSEYFQLARYGQLVLTADSRPRQFTDANEPSKTGYADFLEDFSSNRIILDDDNNTQNSAIARTDKPYFWPRPGLSHTNLIRSGDSISNLTGVLHWSCAGFSGTDAWRLRPVEEKLAYNFTNNNNRQTTPDSVDIFMKIVSFNVLNYFFTIDTGDDICGPSGDMGCRGAHSEAELDRQRAKIAATICKIDADIVGLIEIENDNGDAIENLLTGKDGVNKSCGPYTYIDTGVIGTDAIKVAFIYNSTKVTPVGDFAILDSSVDTRFNDQKNRPALAQTFEEISTSGMLTVVVNHLKSKGSSCDDIGDPDTNDGQGNCNFTRTQAAAAMVDWLATDPTDSDDPDFLIIGDLNSYRNEGPIDAIEAGADDSSGTSDDYTDLLDDQLGPFAYTYLFDGQLGYLNYALVNSSLLDQVTDVTVWHINADEIPVFDYNDGIQDVGEASFERKSTALPIYESNAFRASDHDPVIIGLNLRSCAGDDDGDKDVDGKDLVSYINNSKGLGLDRFAENFGDVNCHMTGQIW